jgi:sugar phosphate isomerase/epimerase
LKFSISNLAWGPTPLDQIIPRLANAGLHGVEIAPTAIWSDLGNLKDEEVLEFKEYLASYNLFVSGIQSLLFGHPELQLFNQNCWEDLKNHLEKVLKIGKILGAEIAVFGSPKNRVRGQIDLNRADDLAEAFLKQLIPSLSEYRMVLTLEPNAPQYGADYLITYEDAIRLSRRIDSESIRPQVDTGCLWMIDKSPVQACELFTPHHIHLSTPDLGPFPGSYDFDPLFDVLRKSEYSGWMVIEMLHREDISLEDLESSINWLVTHAGGNNSGVRIDH